MFIIPKTKLDLEEGESRVEPDLDLNEFKYRLYSSFWPLLKITHSARPNKPIGARMMYENEHNHIESNVVPLDQISQTIQTMVTFKPQGMEARPWTDCRFNNANVINEVHCLLNDGEYFCTRTMGHADSNSSTKSWLAGKKIEPGYFIHKKDFVYFK